ncbi:hypothetical protein ACET3Z_021765 [Daucus carota]
MFEDNENSNKPMCSGPRERLDKLLSEADNKICADCGTQDPKWVSSNIGAFICIQCSGVHRSLGVHISKVFSVKLDEWTNEDVDALESLGGNKAVNYKYESSMPDNFKKPNPDSSIEERTDYIRRKYVLQQFLKADELISLPLPYPSASTSTLSSSSSSDEKRKLEKNKSHKSQSMVEFIGLIKVKTVKGSNLAVRDLTTSDPYLILSLGNQSVKTDPVMNSLNPVWKDMLMLSIPGDIPPLKLHVYDKDTFTTDDYMGEAEIDIQPLVTAAKAADTCRSGESMPLGKLVASKDNTLISDGIISLVDGKVKQDLILELQNVESGVLEVELECVALVQ